MSLFFIRFLSQWSFKTWNSAQSCRLFLYPFLLLSLGELQEIHHSTFVLSWCQTFLLKLKCSFNTWSSSGAIFDTIHPLKFCSNIILDDLIAYLDLKFKSAFILLTQLSILVQDANDDNWAQKIYMRKRWVANWEEDRTQRPNLYKHYYTGQNG